MKLIMNAYRYDTCYPFTFWKDFSDDQITLRFQMEEDKEENDYDGSRELSFKKEKFQNTVNLLIKHPSIQGELYVERDSWNTYPENISVRAKQDYDDDVLMISFSIDQQEYNMEAEVLRGILEAL